VPGAEPSVSPATRMENNRTMRLRNIFWPLSIVFLGTAATGFAQDGGSSCRAPSEEVWYSVNGLQDSAPYDYHADCDIVRAASNGKITIKCPAGPAAMSFEYVEGSELTSSDFGHTWAKEVLGRPIPYDSTLPDIELAAAPSNQAIQYARLRDVGLYIRSEDDGKTWSLPASTVDGKAREQMPGEFGRNGNFTTEFHLLAIDPVDPRHLYSRITLRPWNTLIWINGSLQAHEIPDVFESIDGGEQWHRLKDAPVGVVALSISSARAGLMYVGARDGVLRSKDGGAHWETVGQNDVLMKQPLRKWDKNPEVRRNAPPIPLRIKQITLDQSDPMVVFVVSNKGFYRSLNGGTTWCLLDFGYDELDGANSLAVVPHRPSQILLGTNRGVFISSDRGERTTKIFPR